MWETLVAVVLVVALSPKFQERFVMLPEEVSVKVTVNGSEPFVGVPEKLAVGGGIAPARSLYTVAKLFATTTLPMERPTLGAVPLANCEITSEPTDVGAVPVPILFVRYAVCAPRLALVGSTNTFITVPPLSA